jgi:threonine dehydrogenase-like Zn-dependent dehydrogenase
MDDGTMQGVVFLGDRQVEVREFPRPRPGPGEVLVQMKRAAICGSDLHAYRRPAAHFAGLPAYIPGHEPAGVVAEVGPFCRRVRAGDRVTIYHYMGCGHCAHCLSGYLQFCPERRPLGQAGTVGPNADFMVVDERNCLPLPDELSFEDGAFIACIAGTGFSALRKLALNGEQTVAIFGQGPVGLTGTVMAKALGARVIGIDPAPERLALARQFGADAVLNPADGDLPAAIQDLTRGSGVDAAYETSGAPAAHQAAIDVLRPNGRGVFVGFGSSGPSVNLTTIIGKQLTLMGSFVMPIHYYEDLVRFLLDHDLPPRFQQMITHRFPIAEAQAAFQVADAGTAGKVMFAWA